MAAVVAETMTAAASSPLSAYEQERLKNLMENKRKLDELRLSHMALSLREALAPKTPSPSKAKRLKKKISQEEMEFIVPRRSGRVAMLPEQSYKEVPTDDKDEGFLVRRPSGRRRDLDSRVYASDEARACATSKAEEIDSKLKSGHPSFVKPMTQSHVTGGFWLGLPKHFCSKYLPKKDTTITLVDEDGEESESLYLFNKTGLSAGWRGFAMAHNLVDGDALVYELVKPTTFQIHIVRQSEYLEEANGDS